jgi:fermentation-respiration switch protein FrsA (DUF1100 family)
MILEALGKLAVVAVGGLAALWLVQDRLIYFPGQERPDAALVGHPAVEAIEVATADGLRLLAWQAPPATATSPVLLYLHGNGGTLAHRAGRMRDFLHLGWGVVMVEYRGYGGNPGQPSEDGLAADARAGLEAIQAMGIPAWRTVLWGESLGTGVVVRLAAERPAAVGALILESPFTSLLDMARRHYPWAPARLLLRDRYDSLSRIGAVQAPVLILQGLRDEIVPPAMGHALAAAAGGLVEIWEVPEAGHNDLGLHGAIEAVSGFLARHLARIGTVPPAQ